MALHSYQIRYTPSLPPTLVLLKGPSLLTMASEIGWTTDPACMLATAMVDQFGKSKALAVLLREKLAIIKWMGCLTPTSSSPSIMIIVS